MLPDGTPCNSMYCCQVRKRPHCEHCQKTLPIDDTKHLKVTQSQSKQKHSSRVSAAATIASGKISPKDSSQHQCAKTRLHVLYTGCAWSHNRYGCVMIETHTHTHTHTQTHMHTGTNRDRCPLPHVDFPKQEIKGARQLT